MCQSGFKSIYKLGVIFNLTFKVVVQIYSRFAVTTCCGLVSLFPEMERNAELWLLYTMYQTGPGTLWRMTFCQPGWGCSELIMEPQTVGLINCEGSTRSMCKSVCHAGAVSREQLGQSSWKSLAPCASLATQLKTARITSWRIKGDEQNVTQWLDISVLSTQIKQLFFFF